MESSLKIHGVQNTFMEQFLKLKHLNRIPTFPPWDRKTGYNVLRGKAKKPPKLIFAGRKSAAEEVEVRLLNLQRQGQLSSTVVAASWCIEQSVWNDDEGELASHFSISSQIHN